MDSTSRYRINRPQVITETIEGEAVIIHQGTGAYYSIAATGAAVWAGVEAEASLGEITAFIEGSYADAGADEVAAGVEGLIDELRQEDLIVDANGDGPPGELKLDGGPKQERFAPPALRKFTDMQDLILIDPVHEVDERGWPHADPGARAGDAG
jgi:hypothetical protein